MFKKINLDHCYNEDPNFKFFKKLGKMGFNLEPGVVEHPGKAFCKFIAVQSSNKRERFYLEFIHIGKGGGEEKTPGLSFNYTENLEGFHKKLSKVVRCDLTHKNYDWKKNAVDRLPGWNMLTFKRQPIKDLFTWFTEFESSRKQRSLKKVKAHPNSVYSIHGIKLVLTQKSKENLEVVLSKKLGQKNKMSDGAFLYIEEGKKDFFEAIILNCRSMQKLQKFMKDEEVAIFENMDAVRLNNASEKGNMWDLLIIEN